MTPKPTLPPTQVPKIEPPNVEPPPKVEPPEVEPPKVEPPKVEPPKVEAPKVEAPKVETPKVEKPKARDPGKSPKVEQSPTRESRTQLEKAEELTLKKAEAAEATLKSDSAKRIEALNQEFAANKGKIDDLRKEIRTWQETSQAFWQEANSARVHKRATPKGQELVQSLNDSRGKEGDRSSPKKWQDRRRSSGEGVNAEGQRGRCHHPEIRIGH